MAKEAKEHHLKVPKTARVYVIEPDGPHRATVLAIHGYRQLGRYFIRHFESLASMGYRIVVPEGLHRFYIEGYSGRVGASWMTKDDREADIEDYINYLQQVAESFDLYATPWILLGFSQGGPTACRWLPHVSSLPESLILHSTVFPNDFEFESFQEELRNLPTHAIFGDSDPFASEEVISEKVEWMKRNGVHPKLTRFEGGHVVHLESVRDILK